MESETSAPETVMKAAQLIIERGYGKAPVVVEQRHYEAMTERELRQHLEEHLAVIRAHGFLGDGGEDDEKKPH
jgi:predicted transcriptional regulator